MKTRDESRSCFARVQRSEFRNQLVKKSVIGHEVGIAGENHPVKLGRSPEVYTLIHTGIGNNHVLANAFQKESSAETLACSKWFLPAAIDTSAPSLKRGDVS